jgi:hypothetical protein
VSVTPIPTWLKYSLGLALAVGTAVFSAVPDLVLPSTQDSGWSPLVGLVHAIVVGTAFSLLAAFATKIWSHPNQDDRPTSRFVQMARKPLAVFALFAGCDFVLEVSARPLFSWISHHAGLEATLAWSVEAGKGYLLPLAFLAVFIGVMLFRRRRTR